MKIFKKMVMILAVASITACSSTKYAWNEYDEDLHQYYKDPGNRAFMIKSLSKTIAQGERNKRVPPGIYAEYAYFLAENGQTDLAIQYFNKEKAAWPESAVLMDKMIKNFNSKGTK